MGVVPREKMMLKGHLLKVIYHKVYNYTDTYPGESYITEYTSKRKTTWRAGRGRSLGLSMTAQCGALLNVELLPTRNIR